MRRKRNIRLVTAIFMAIALALFLPSLSIAGSLEPPDTAVDALGNPVPTMDAKFACRGAFMNNNNGAVTDCKTGMTWMRDANCFGTKNWEDAKSSCSTLASGSCGLTDGSLAGDWRLPTIEEFKTLPDRNYTNPAPALSNAKGDAHWTSGDAFNNVQSDIYWSATTFADNTSNAWYVHLGNGGVYSGDKTGYGYVWCVRGGQ
jgi:hypothetical protein